MRLKCYNSEGREIPETGSPVKFLTAMLCSLTQFLISLIMSNLQNEILLENIYEEVISEATDTGNLAMMSEKDIETEVYNRFYSLSD